MFLLSNKAPSFGDLLVVILWYILVLIIIIFASGIDNDVVDYIEASGIFSSSNHTDHCRFTDQGRHFVVDDRGRDNSRNDKLYLMVY